MTDITQRFFHPALLFLAICGLLFPSSAFAALSQPRAKKAIAREVENHGPYPADTFCCRYYPVRTQVRLCIRKSSRSISCYGETEYQLDYADTDSYWCGGWYRAIQRRSGYVRARPVWNLGAPDCYDYPFL